MPKKSKEVAEWEGEDEPQTGRERRKISEHFTHPEPALITSADVLL